jgi:hypothetical protein
MKLMLYESVSSYVVKRQSIGMARFLSRVWLKISSINLHQGIKEISANIEVAFINV